MVTATFGTTVTHNDLGSLVGRVGGMAKYYSKAFLTLEGMRQKGNLYSNLLSTVFCWTRTRKNRSFLFGKSSAIVNYCTVTNSISSSIWLENYTTMRGQTIHKQNNIVHSCKDFYKMAQ